MTDLPRDTAALRQRTAEGFLDAHRRLNATASRLLDAGALVAALVEALVDEGLVDRVALEARKERLLARMGVEFVKGGMGVVLQDPEQDKYAFAAGVEIDCENRVHLCHAACCRLPFALSRQDLAEGIVRWRLGRPYMIEHAEDGYCTHLDRCAKGCSVYQQRPVPCRGFDCRDNPFIWLDFAARIPNPIVERADWLSLVSADENAATP
jgi:hypothetical protein